MILVTMHFTQKLILPISPYLRSRVDYTEHYGENHYSIQEFELSIYNIAKVKEAIANGQFGKHLNEKLALRGGVKPNKWPTSNETINMTSSTNVRTLHSSTASCSWHFSR